MSLFTKKQSPALILVVEDNHHLRHGLAEIIDESPHAFKALMAPTADEALSILQSKKGLFRQQVSAIISDINLPLKDGMSFLEDLNAMGKQCASIPVILWTTHNDDAVRRTIATYAQIVGYFWKLDDLEDVLGELLIQLLDKQQLRVMRDQLLEAMPEAPTA